MTAPLSPAARTFILHWGQMGQRWGINRTVAQIHALLFLSEEPLHAGQIVERLGVVKSNVSNSLRELQRWGVVQRVAVMGDRRDHYEATKDVWEMFRLIMDERRTRECDPTVELLRELTATSSQARRRDAFTHQQLDRMLDFYETVTTWYEQVRRMPTRSIIRVMKLGDRVLKLLDAATPGRGQKRKRAIAR